MGNFNTKYAVTRHESCIKLGVFKVAQFNGLVEIYHTDTVYANRPKRALFKLTARCL